MNETKDFIYFFKLGNKEDGVSLGCCPQFAKAFKPKKEVVGERKR